jgi:hydrogenase maturation factor
MCFSDIAQVVKINRKSAQLVDGRIVDVSHLQRVAVGDYLEVFADLVLDKVPPEEAQEILKERKKLYA